MKMEVQIQHAYVAQVDEPEFCPSSLASLIPHDRYGHLSDIVSEVASNRDPYTNELQGQYRTRPIAESYDYTVSSILRPQYSSHESQHLYHPRPESHEIAQEEDGRRNRLAIEDPDEYAEILQRILHLDPPSDDPHLLVQDVGGQYVSESDLSADRQALHAPSLTAGVPALYVYDMEYEALAVDHPRRSFDFKDFMQTQIRDESSRKDKSPVPGVDISSLLPTSSDRVTRSSLGTNNVDIQGLRWSDLDFSRDQIVGSRTAQHPSNRTRNRITERIFPAVDMSFTAERRYCFRSCEKRLRPQYSHYQLRHVLAATDRNAIYYATGSKVMKAALSCPDQEWTAMDLSNDGTSQPGVRITCLSASTAPRYPSYRTDNVLLAGGFSGEYAMLDLNAQHDSDLHTGFVTHAYNGLVTHIDSYAHRRSGQLQACFCSNDCKIRILDVKTNRFTDIFSYENAANCTAISPDGRLRALVGDSHDALIADAERGDILVTLKGHNAYGFACAWSKDGRHVATGAEDRKVILWDARNWSKPLRVMPCSMATARSLHFTDDGALVVGEDDDLVTVYHAKREEVRQDIRFFGSIAGVALCDGGDEMIIANADKTVGGLLSFQRNSDGINGGYREGHVADGGGGRRRRHSPSSTFRRRCEFVSELVV